MSFDAPKLKTKEALAMYLYELCGVELDGCHAMAEHIIKELADTFVEQGLEVEYFIKRFGDEMHKPLNEHKAIYDSIRRQVSWFEMVKELKKHLKWTAQRMVEEGPTTGPPDKS